MIEERRSNPNPLDVAGILAILYTVGFLILAALLYFVQIPAVNKDALLYLFGILSGIELSIIGAYFGTSKAAEAVQRSLEQRQSRSATVVEQIARSVPSVVAAAAPSMKTDEVKIDATNAAISIEGKKQ